MPAETKPRSAGGPTDIGKRSAIEAHGRESPPGAAPDVALEDWSLMFGAALDRLRLIFDALQRALARDVQDDHEADWLRVNLLDCLEDLARLHTLITDELHPRRMPDPECFSANAAMAWPPVRQK